ncbi:MAG: M1 family metallopeptidase [Planctomycetia bacterium]|nr:M1 family metallopeptidase [Planctomycetia bacterium]
MTRIGVCRSIVVFVFCLSAGVHSSVGQERKLHFAADRPVDMKHIRLDLRVNLEKEHVDARATLDMAALRDVSHIKLDAVGFETKGVTVSIEGGQPQKCDFDNDGQKITLNLPEPLPRGRSVQATIDYALQSPESGLHFYGPTEGDPDAPRIVWSQGESITNRYWVPCFDHPNEMQTTEIVATVDDPNIAISNGKLLEEKKNADGSKTFHWLQDKPHVVYLMTLVVGEFYSETETWRGKPVSYHVRPKFKDKIKNSFGNTTKMLDFFSDRIGVEYPWDKYAQVCCYNFGGGMENTSATTLMEGTLHDDRAHLDGDSDGLVAHELAHQWWGDLLTCRDWAHIWLNEGFATYFEALWDEHHNGPDEFAINMHRKAGGAIGGGRDKPIVWPGYKDPDEQFDSRAYPKGAWVVHMIRRRLGDEMFWKAINLYTTRNRHQNVETIDLRRAIEDASGESFGRFFYDWTERPGCPDVKVSYRWQAEDGLAAITIEQRQKDEAFIFPMKLEFRFAETDEPYVFTQEVTEKRQQFYLPLKYRPTLMRVDPDMAVLMELTEEKPRDLWVGQLCDDPNPVRRIQAAEHFGKGDRERDVRLLATQLLQEKFWAVQEAIARALGKSEDDEARDALLAGLTIEHPKARRAVVEALGNFRDETKVEAALLKLVQDGDASYRVEAAAISSWADVCQDEPSEMLETLLTRESDGEIIRSAVIEALGRHGEPGVIDLLTEWAEPDKDNRCRAAAVRAIAEAATRIGVDEEAQEFAVETILTCLHRGSRRLQVSALEALGSMGSAAKAALPELDRYAEIGQPRVRTRAAEMAKKIRAGDSTGKGTGELRDEVAKLKKENRRLLDRLEKIEAKLEGHPEPMGTR